MTVKSTDELATLEAVIPINSFDALKLCRDFTCKTDMSQHLRVGITTNYSE